LEYLIGCYGGEEGELMVGWGKVIAYIGIACSPNYQTAHAVAGTGMPGQGMLDVGWWVGREWTGLSRVGR